MESEHVIDKIRDCPVLVTISVIGGKWKPRVLWHLRSGAARFGNLQRAIGASEKVLSQTLKALETAGIVMRTIVPAGKVVTTEYAFTDYGRTLIPILDAMGDWGLAHQRPPAREPQ